MSTFVLFHLQAVMESLKGIKSPGEGCPLWMILDPILLLDAMMEITFLSLHWK